MLQTVESRAGRPAVVSKTGKVDVFDRPHLH